jgi:hypothetical protein
LSKRKPKEKPINPRLALIGHNIKVGDNVIFKKAPTLGKKKIGDTGTVAKIEECSYATGGWKIWLEGEDNSPGWSIYFFIEKDWPPYYKEP